MANALSIPDPPSPESSAPDSADSGPPSSAPLADPPPPIPVNAVPVSSTAGGPAPAALVNVCPQYTRADWHWVAMKTAFGESTARDIRDGKAWLVGPWSSFKANKAIIHAVYDYYGALYKRNPSKCVWAGLGRVAGGPFFWGFQFIDDWIQSIDSDPCFRVPDTWGQALLQLFCDPTDPGKTANVVIRANCQSAIESLMQMGRAIFEDLAWQHEAYLAGGLSEILRLGGQPGVFDQYKDRQQECLDAWKLIDLADPTGPTQGNLALFQREQLYTIPPGYAALHALLVVPTIMSFLASSPHPWGVSFYDYWQLTSAPLPPWGGNPKWGPAPSGQSWPGAVLGHDVTNDADRWSWMRRNIYPKWMSVSEGQRATMVGLSLEKLCAHDWPPGI